MEMPDVQVLVESVANKQQRNKRKRDPDMYLDAVLECTVRKLNRERMEREENLRKRRRTDANDRTLGYTCCTASDNSLSEKISPECTRTLNNDSMLSSEIKTDCDQDTNFANLEDELSSDLKDLLDELSREFPCDFGLADTNNNTTVENKDTDGDMWLTSFVEVLCST